jgi:hypothetical protein
MNAEFFEEVNATQVSPTERPEVQAFARAISESIPPATQREAQGGLTYPLPGKGVSGETTN